MPRARLDSNAANRLVEIVRKMFNWARLAVYVPKSYPNPAVGAMPFGCCF
jgi:hypothetical protein